MPKTNILDLPLELIFRLFDDFGALEMYIISKIDPIFHDLALAFGQQHPQARPIRTSWNKDWALTQDQIITDLLDGIIGLIEYYEYTKTQEYYHDQIDEYINSRPEGFWETYTGFH